MRSVFFKALILLLKNAYISKVKLQLHLPAKVKKKSPLPKGSHNKYNQFLVILYSISIASPYVKKRYFCATASL